MSEELTIQQLRQLTQDQLSKKHEELVETLARLRFDVVQGKLKGTHEIQRTRRSIARILTIVKEKQSAS